MFSDFCLLTVSFHCSSSNLSHKSFLLISNNMFKFGFVIAVCSVCIGVLITAEESLLNGNKPNGLLLPKENIPPYPVIMNGTTSQKLTLVDKISNQSNEKNTIQLNPLGNARFIVNLAPIEDSNTFRKGEEKNNPSNVILTSPSLIALKNTADDSEWVPKEKDYSHGMSDITSEASTELFPSQTFESSTSSQEFQTKSKLNLTKTFDKNNDMTTISQSSSTVTKTDQTEATGTDQAESNQTDVTGMDQAESEKTEATGTDQAKSEKTEATGTDQVESEKTEVTGTDQAESEKTGATRTDQTESEKTEATGTDHAEKEKTVSTATDQAESEKTEATATDQAESEKTEVTGTDQEKSEQTSATETEQIGVSETGLPKTEQTLSSEPSPTETTAADAASTDNTEDLVSKSSSGETELLTQSTDNIPSSSDIPKDKSIPPGKEKTTTNPEIEDKTKVEQSSPSEISVTETTTVHFRIIKKESITTIKLALSLTFLVISLIAMAVLIAYMVRMRRRTIPYEELSLEP